jgi:8-oxo-dGTP diphosphatase
MRDQSRHYVLGFLFKGQHVLLIEKQRPAWCKGLLNGVGGKIEPGESPAEAMYREAVEEAAVVADWERFVVMRLSGGGTVHCYYARTCSWQYETRTDEIVNWYDSKYLPSNTVKHVRWLLPLALDTEVVKPVEVHMQKVSIVDWSSFEQPR